MRTRVKEILGREARSCPVIRRTYLGMEVDVLARDIPAEPLGVSKLTDVEDSDRQLVNPCTHEKTGWQLLGRTDIPTAVGVPYVSYMEGSTGFNVLAPTMSVVGSALSQISRLNEYSWDKYLAAFSYEKWSREKWPGPRVSLNTGFDLINFLRELPETISMIRGWTTRKGFLAHWHGVFGRNRTIGERLKALASERLSYSFGLKPFLSDAKTLFNLVRTWRQRADKFEQQMGKLRRTYKKPFVYSYQVGAAEEWVLPVFDVPESTFVLNKSVEVEFHAETYFTFMAPEFRTFMSRLCQLGDTFGISSDAGVVWESIPFSFVIDWFINVGPWLEANVDRDWVKTELTLLENSRSAKIVETRELAWRHSVVSEGIPGSFLEETPVAINVAKYYSREGGLPYNFTKVDLEVQTDPWRVDRIINAVALSVQKAPIAKRKRRRAEP